MIVRFPLKARLPEKHPGGFVQLHDRAATPMKTD